MDDATALLTALEATPPDAPTACRGWRAHDLVAHLAAGAAEMADLVEDRLAGRAERPTRAFAEREAPYRDLPDAALREALVTQALRLAAAREALAAVGGDVAFTGSRLDAEALALHGRCEAALHRWDLVGDDDVGDLLLADPALTGHAVRVLDAMAATLAESPVARAARLQVQPTTVVLRSPGRPDVVLSVADGGRATLRSCAPVGGATLVTDPATRLLLLWGRRSPERTITWGAVDGERAVVEALLGVRAPTPRRLTAPGGAARR